MLLNKILRPAMLLTLLGVSGAASATVVTWDFQSNGSNVSLGTSSTFISSPVGFNLTAFGFDGSNVATNLFAKFTDGVGPGFDETGVGLTNDPTGDHEIGPTSYINLLVPFANMGYLFTVGSLQSGESASLWGCSAIDGTTGVCTGLTLLQSFTGGPTQQTSSLFSGYAGYQLLGVTNNVLLDAVTSDIQDVPEPTTLALLGLGLLGLGAFRRRRA